MRLRYRRERRGNEGGCLTDEMKRMVNVDETGGIWYLLV